MITNIVKSP